MKRKSVFQIRNMISDEVLDRRIDNEMDYPEDDVKRKKKYIRYSSTEESTTNGQGLVSTTFENIS